MLASLPFPVFFSWSLKRQHFLLSLLEICPISYKGVKIVTGNQFIPKRFSSEAFRLFFYNSTVRIRLWFWGFFFFGCLFWLCVCVCCCCLPSTDSQALSTLDFIDHNSVPCLFVCGFLRSVKYPWTRKNGFYLYGDKTKWNKAQATAS